MSGDSTPIRGPSRRRALGWGHVNGGLWAAGNALSAGTLVIYLARDLGAAGLGLSLVLATPNLAGLLRLAAPALIYRAETARRACLVCSLASYALIVGLPLIAALAPLVSRRGAVAAMIGLLFAHQVLEYLGGVALWSWWGDLVPRRIRGRYFARRQMIQLAVTIPLVLGAGQFSDAWRARYRDDPQRVLWAYALPTGAGAALLLGSLGPLLLMPATRRYPRPERRLVWSVVRAPLVDRRFWRYLVFRGWFSLANGVTQVVQSVIYPREVLGFGMGPMAAMRVAMQVGQMAGARPAGRLSDRFGNRPVLVSAQACVAAALAFYLVARPETRWLMAGAWLLFSAYVAHNICLPNLVLKLSPELARPAYVATAEALASVLHAASTVAGGLAFDYLQATSDGGAAGLQGNCLAILSAGLAMRALAVPLAAAIREPGAWTWRAMLAGVAGRADRGGAQA